MQENDKFFQCLLIMKTVINSLLILLVIFIFSVNVFSQEKESDRLKRQQKELQDKITFTENLLKSTESNKTNLTSSISLISNKIRYREALLNNITIQLKTLNSEVKELSEELEYLNKQLIGLEQQYKNMLIQAYKIRSESASVFFVISSSNYNQAIKRMAYLNQLTKHRADQIKKIRALRLTIEEKKRGIELKELNQQKLLVNKENEKTRYLKDRQKKLTVIKSLEGEEKKLQDELQAQRNKASQIKKAISNAIKKEIAEAQKREKAKPKSLAETKEIQLNNAGFESNKGRLPWPVSKGEITKGYGRQAHPVHVGVYTNNKGIDISTVKGASVRAVYKGKVTSIINIPGAGKAIIVSHGNYRTIYSNLQTVYVQKGDELETKQELGALLLNSNGSFSEVHFEIIKISSEGQINNLNPSFWIYQ